MVVIFSFTYFKLRLTLNFYEWAPIYWTIIRLCFLRKTTLQFVSPFKGYSDVFNWVFLLLETLETFWKRVVEFFYWTRQLFQKPTCVCWSLYEMANISVTGHFPARTHAGAGYVCNVCAGAFTSPHTLTVW